MPDSRDSTTESEPVVTAADQLYAAPPEEFMSLRTELSKDAKANGDPDAAKQIAALRKPTVAAALVNRQVLAEPESIERLAELYDRLRQAHEDLDAGTLRDLSTERRSAVADLTRDALDRGSQSNPSVAVRDEVVGTFDAAVADPEILARLGRLTKAERWSGFGVAIPADGTPALRLVRGGKSSGPKRPVRTKAVEDDADEQAPVQTAAQKREASAAARRVARMVEKARTAFDTADDALANAERTEQSGAERIKSLTTELAELTQELDEAKRELDKSRREVKSARTRRREARSALDRAERQADR